MSSPAITRLVEAVNAALIARAETIVTAESCTGGLIAAALTDVPGSSAAVFGGFVIYANEAKSAMIGVDPELIRRHGAVSAEVARAMADGALRHSEANVAIAVTGIAGPGGGSADKPVGLVHFACATAGETVVLERRYGDVGRQRVREETTAEALRLVLTQLGAPLP
ncbi:MAG TPA: CinA family protein [Devosia sp.]|jgi:nicotinamide-nucleotide amidase|nr:CinA family protein [Devosia sp.]